MTHVDTLNMAPFVVSEITVNSFTVAYKSGSPQTAIRREEALYGLFDAETGAIWNS